MGGKREYTAIFQIGGKLLGSFKSAMAAADARIARLRTNMLSLAKTVGRMTFVFSALGAALGALGISKIIGSLFEGAVEQAEEARQRINSTIASFLQLDEVRKRGGKDAFGYAQEILDNIYKQNEALSKQSVLHTDIYNEMTKVAAQGEIPPRQVKAMMEGMGDLLVKTRGVHATEQEAAELMSAVVSAIHGKTKAMRAFGIFIDPTKGTGKNKVAKSYQEIYEEILAITKVKGIAGFAERAVGTDEGKIQIMQNRLQDVREEIGNKLLPVRAKMAEAWLAILTPENVQLMLDGIGWIYDKLIELVNYIKNDFLPLLKSEEGQKKLKQTGAVLVWLAKHWKLVGAILIGFIASMWALSAVMTVVNILAAPLGLLIGAVAVSLGILVGTVVFAIMNWKLFYEIIQNAWKTLGNVPVIGPALQLIFLPLKTLIDAINWIVTNWPLISIVAVQTWNKVKSIFSTAWEYLKKGFIALGRAILEAMLTPINKIIDGINVMIDAANKLNPFKKIPHVPNIGMPGGGGGAGAGGAGAPAVAGVGVTGVARAAWGAGAGPAGATAAAAAAMSGGVPVTVASYGGPEEPGQIMGSYGNLLAPGDVAISPNLMPILGAPGPGSYMMLDGQRYHIADSSWYHPGEPTSNMVELWGFGNQIKRAGTAMRAYAMGGIAKTPQLATLAERGPEAVLPLASSALSSLTGNGAGETHVNFAPNITVNGNMSEAEQRALDVRLRNLSRDFVEQFKAAQWQERRLSYESGYD